MTDVQWLLPDGEGGAPHEGGTVRLPGGLPGDRVGWREIGRKGRTIQGLVEAIEAPSPDRRAPPCPWDAECGGCDLAALAPEARRLALARIAQRALGLDAPPEMVPSPRQTAHRARIKLAIDGGRVGYREARSHRLVEIGTCAAAREEVQVALPRLRELDPAALAGFESVEIRSDGTRAVYRFDGRATDAAALAPLGDVAVGERALHGDPTLWLRGEPSGQILLRASPLAFYQVNLEINAALVAHVREAVRALAAERVLDLYAGIGNLSLPIAHDGPAVAAVEQHAPAIADLRASAARAGLEIEAIVADVGRLDPSRHAFDVVVLDPPRAGAPGVMERLVRNRPRGIVYVSCHVASAARDLRAATAAGYRITQAVCFEMFPDTRHFETVITLRR